MPLSESQFQELLDTYGSNPLHWPAYYSHAAKRLLDRSKLARQQLEQMRELEARLDQWTLESPDPIAVASILMHVREQNKPCPAAALRVRRWWNSESLWPSLAVGLGGLLGGVLGMIETDAAMVLIESPEAMLAVIHLHDLPALFGLP